MKTFILLIAVVLSSTVAMADGGKNMRGDMGQEVIYTETGTVLGSIYDVPEDCEVIVSESRKTILTFCDKED